MLRLLAAALACTAMTGCVQNYAERDIAQGAAPGSLAVVNAPAGSTVFVDGRAYAGSETLTPGRHEVVVQLDGRAIHTQAVFIAAGSRAEVRVP